MLIHSQTLLIHHSAPPASSRSSCEGKWLEERAELGSRCSWLQLRLADLEERIQQMVEIHKHIRSTKVSQNSSVSTSKRGTWHYEQTCSLRCNLPRGFLKLWYICSFCFRAVWCLQSPRYWLTGGFGSLRCRRWQGFPSQPQMLTMNPAALYVFCTT